MIPTVRLEWRFPGSHLWFRLLGTTMFWWWRLLWQSYFYVRQAACTPPSRVSTAFADQPVLVAILLGGCTQEGLRHVYLLSLVYTGATSPTSDTAQVDTQYPALLGGLVPGNITSRLEIRIGYFGFCLMDGGPALPSVICSSTLDDLAASMAVVGNGSADPLNLLWAAKSFHDGVIFSGLM